MREIANLKLENDILKKAAIILGTKPLQGGRAMIQEIMEKTGAGIRKVCEVRGGAAPAFTMPARLLTPSSPLPI